MAIQFKPLARIQARNGVLIAALSAAILGALPGRVDAAMMVEYHLKCQGGYADGNYQETCWYEPYFSDDGGSGGGLADHADSPGGAGDPDGGQSPCDSAVSAPVVETRKGNPIEISTGAKIETVVDFRSLGQAPLSLERQYRSDSPRDGIFGRYWESNFDYRLQVSGTSLILSMPFRGLFLFNPDASAANTWKSAANGVEATVSLAGSVYTVTWKDGAAQRFDTAGRVLSSKDGFGVGYDFTYDTGGKLSRVTAASGRYVRFVWTGNELTTVVDPAGNAYTYTYLSNRFGAGTTLLQSVAPPGNDRNDVQYLYENAAFPGALTGKKNGVARYSWFTYDSAGRATSTEHKVGAKSIEKYTFAYSTPAADALVVNETNPLGKQASYRFVKGQVESVTGLPSVSCPASLFTTTRDANGFPDIVTDFNGGQTDLDYDSAGRPVRAVYGSGSPNSTVVTYEWDTAKNRLLKRTVVGDSSVAYTYDAAGRVASKTTTNLSSLGTPNQQLTTTFTYTTHPNGLLASVTENGPLPGNGDSVTRTYSATGDELSLSTALGVQKTASLHNALGLPGRTVDAFGVTLDFAYDVYGALISTARTVGGTSSTVTRQYDARGRLDRIQRPEGDTEFLNYDNADRLVSRQMPEQIIDSPPGENATQSLWYATEFNVMSEPSQVSSYRRQAWGTFDPRTHESTLGSAVLSRVDSFSDYDELNRLKAVRGNNGQNFRLGYDESGYVTSRVDSLGNTMTLSRDAQNRVVTATDAKGGVTRFAYDAGGRVSSVTDPRGLITRYRYDGLGKLQRLESPDTGTTVYTYDGYGRLSTEKRADGSIATFAYDAQGRPVSKTVGTVTQSITYDNCTNGLGRTCGYSSAAGSTSFSYSPSGRVTRQVSIVGGVTYTTTFAYDALDRLSAVTYPDGGSATYSYADRQLRAIRYTSGTSTSVVADTLRYAPDGRVTSLRYGNGLVRSTTLDVDGRPVAIQVKDAVTGAVVQGLALSYDANNNVTSIVNARDAAASQSYGYDQLMRIVSAGRGDGITETFGFDSSGNRTSHLTTGAPTEDLSYAAGSNRLVSSSASRTWTFDAKGNNTRFVGADGVAVALHYDVFGRIDSSTRGSETTSYQVDAAGRRVAKSGPSGASQFVYDLDGAILAEQVTGTGWTNYIRANGALVGMARSGTLYFVHEDNTGRPELVSDAAKNVVWSARNSAFERQVGASAIGALNLGLPGQYYDQETRTWNNLFRDYDGNTGRYLQSDPIGLLGGINTYAYVNGNPAMYVDPTGLVERWVLRWGPAAEGAGAIFMLGTLVGSASYWVGEHYVDPALNWTFTQVTGTTPANFIYESQYQPTMITATLLIPHQDGSCPVPAH